MKKRLKESKVRGMALALSLTMVTPNATPILANEENITEATDENIHNENEDTTDTTQDSKEKEDQAEEKTDEEKTDEESQGEAKENDAQTSQENKESQEEPEEDYNYEMIRSASQSIQRSDGIDGVTKLINANFLNANDIHDINTVNFKTYEISNNSDFTNAINELNNYTEERFIESGISKVDGAYPVLFHFTRDIELSNPSIGALRDFNPRVKVISVFASNDKNTKRTIDAWDKLNTDLSKNSHNVEYVFMNLILKIRSGVQHKRNFNLNANTVTFCDVTVTGHSPGYGPRVTIGYRDSVPSNPKKKAAVYFIGNNDFQLGVEFRIGNYNTRNDFDEVTIKLGNGTINSTLKIPQGGWNWSEELTNQSGFCTTKGGGTVIDKLNFTVEENANIDDNNFHDGGFDSTTKINTVNYNITGNVPNIDKIQKIIEGNEKLKVTGNIDLTKITHNVDHLKNLDDLTLLMNTTDSNVITNIDKLFQGATEGSTVSIGMYKGMKKETVEKILEKAKGGKFNKFKFHNTAESLTIINVSEKLKEYGYTEVVAECITEQDVKNFLKFVEENSKSTSSETEISFVLDLATLDSLKAADKAIAENYDATKHSKLKRIQFSKDITEVSSNQFSGYEFKAAGKVALKLPLSIRSNAFSNASGILNVENIEEITIIGDSAFSSKTESGKETKLVYKTGSNGEKTLNLNKVVSVGSRAFYNTVLVNGQETTESGEKASIVLNSGVTSIGSEAFYGQTVIGDGKDGPTLFYEGSHIEKGAFKGAQLGISEDKPFFIKDVINENNFSKLTSLLEGSTGYVKAKAQGNPATKLKLETLVKKYNESNTGLKIIIEFDENLIINPRYYETSEFYDSDGFYYEKLGKDIPSSSTRTTSSSGIILESNVGVALVNYKDKATATAKNEFNLSSKDATTYPLEEVIYLDPLVDAKYKVTELGNELTKEYIFKGSALEKILNSETAQSRESSSESTTEKAKNTFNLTNVKKVNANSFKNAEMSNSKILLSNVTELGKEAFANSTLKNVEVALGSVTNAGTKVFGESKLSNSKVTLSSFKDGAFEKSTIEGSEIILNSGTSESRSSSSELASDIFKESSVKNSTLSITTSSLGEGAFTTATLANSTLNLSVKNIEKNAFAGANLSKVAFKLETAVTNIGEGAFSGITEKSQRAGESGTETESTPLEKTTIYFKSLPTFGESVFKNSSLTLDLKGVSDPTEVQLENLLKAIVSGNEESIATSIKESATKAKFDILVSESATSTISNLFKYIRKYDLNNYVSINGKLAPSNYKYTTHKFKDENNVVFKNIDDYKGNYKELQAVLISLTTNNITDISETAKASTAYSITGEEIELDKLIYNASTETQLQENADVKITQIGDGTKNILGGLSNLKGKTLIFTNARKVSNGAFSDLNQENVTVKLGSSLESIGDNAFNIKGKGFELVLSGISGSVSKNAFGTELLNEFTINLEDAKSVGYTQLLGIVNAICNTIGEASLETKNTVNIKVASSQIEKDLKKIIRDIYISSLNENSTNKNLTKIINYIKINYKAAISSDNNYDYSNLEIGDTFADENGFIYEKLTTSGDSNPISLVKFNKEVGEESKFGINLEEKDYTFNEGTFNGIKITAQGIETIKTTVVVSKIGNSTNNANIFSGIDISGKTLKFPGVKIVEVNSLNGLTTNEATTVEFEQGIDILGKSFANINVVKEEKPETSDKGENETRETIKKGEEYKLFTLVLKKAPYSLSSTAFSNSNLTLDVTGFKVLNYKTSLISAIEAANSINILVNEEEEEEFIKELLKGLKSKDNVYVNGKEIQSKINISFKDSSNEVIEDLKNLKSVTLDILSKDYDNLIEKLKTLISGTSYSAYTIKVQDEEGNLIKEGDTIKSGVTYNVILTKELFKVTFISNDSVYTTVDATENGNVKTINDPKREGYTFKGWFLDDKYKEEFIFYTGTNQSTATVVTKDTTLYAKWEEDKKDDAVTVVKYKVSFNTNGGTNILPIEAEYNTILKIPTPLKPGYSFIGWYVDQELTKLYDTKKAFGFKQDITLYAAWGEGESSSTLDVGGSTPITNVGGHGGGSNNNSNKKPEESEEKKTDKPTNETDSKKENLDKDELTKPEKEKANESQKESTQETKQITSEVITLAEADESKEVEFKDVSSSHWATEQINFLAKADIVKGVDSETFNPLGITKRADFIIMIVKLLGLENEEYSQNFSDVSDNKYYASYVGIAKKYGIVKGNDNKFNPEKSITRQDTMVIINNVLEMLNIKVDKNKDILKEFKDYLEISSYALNSVAALVNLGIVLGDNNQNINPKADITRAEISVIIYKLHDLLKDKLQ